MRAGSLAMDGGKGWTTRRSHAALGLAAALAAFGVGFILPWMAASLHAASASPPAAPPAQTSVILVPDAADWGPIILPARDAAAEAKLKGYVWSPAVWGFVVTQNGRSLDLASGLDWDNPDALPNQVDAGFGWRDREVTAVLGYSEPGFPLRVDQMNRQEDAGRVGFSVTFHPH